MAYTRVNWANTPATTSPINATNLNVMDGEIKNLDNQANYILATAGTGGKFYINIANTLVTYMTLKVKIPAPTTGTSAAELSIAGSGGTYKAITNRILVALTANQITDKYIDLVYDGTEWIVENIGVANDSDLGQYIVFSKTSDQTLTTASETDIDWEATTAYGGADFASISSGDITFLKTGYYLVTQTNVYESNATGNRYVVLNDSQQRTVSVGASRVNATDIIAITSVGATLVSRAYQNSGGNLKLTTASRCKVLKIA